MIQTGLKIDKIGEFLKDYLSVLIIVPAIFGGLWQIMELMSISTTYIRFFSISQIVPDGILILFFIAFGSFGLLLAVFADTLFFTKEKSTPTYLDDDEFEIYRKRQLLVWKIIFIIFYSGSVYFYVKYMSEKIIYSEFKSEIGLSLVVIFWLNLSLHKVYLYTKDKYKGYIKFCNVLLLMIYIIIGIYLCKRIHKVFIEPDNIINFYNVKNDIAKLYPNTQQQLLYYNDKYIFVKIIKKFKRDKKGKILNHTNEKILIMEFENLFNENPRSAKSPTLR